MIQFESGNPFAIGSQSWFTQLSELSSIQKGLQDILLHILMALGDTLQLFSQGNEIFYCLIDAVVSVHIIAGRFESQYIMIAHIMFGKAIFVIPGGLVTTVRVCCA